MSRLAEFNIWSDRRLAQLKDEALLQFLKWIGTALQLTGCVIVALHVPWSGWAFPVMLAGSAIWSAIAVGARDGPLVTLSVVFSLTNVVGIWRWLA